MQVRRAIAESLESGKFHGIVSRVASRAWGHAASHALARPLIWPADKRVVAIGGATLGGSGKTPLALACAAHLCRANVRVCVVGHAYGASPRVARVVAPDDALALVGDEAAMCAAALALPRQLRDWRGLGRVATSHLSPPAGPADGNGTVLESRGTSCGTGFQNHGIPPGSPDVLVDASPLGRPRSFGRFDAPALAGIEVIVAPERQAALDLAFARGADVAILDGVLQTAPLRATLALLAVDGREPWGAGACPPAGDLRAPPAALVATSDQMVRIGAGAGMDAVASSRGAWLGDRLVPWSELRVRAVGLVSALARPGRVVAMLAEHGVRPVHAVTLADHASRARVQVPPPDRVPVDLWLATAKCRTGLPARLGGAPVATLDYELTLAAAVQSPLDAIAHSVAHQRLGTNADPRQHRSLQATGGS